MIFTMNLLYILSWIPGGVVHTLFAVAAILYLLAVTCGVLRLFQKAGRKQWHALIPFYGTYDLFSIAWRGWIGPVYRTMTILVFLLLPKTLHLFSEGFRGTVCFLLMLCAIILSIIMKIKLGRSFHMGSGFTFAMFFAPGICSVVLGYSHAKYFGPTLVRERITGNVPLRQKHMREHLHTAGAFHRYMINLYKWRSMMALFACIVTLVFSVNAINWGITSYAHKGESVFNLFQYFTIISNSLTALASSFVIPYAIDGIHRKRFDYPRWIAMFHYAGTICTTLTMAFAVLLISWFNPDFAFGRYNFWLHLVCPIAVLISFFMVESGRQLSKADMFICMGPFAIYSLFYVVNVVLIGQENGGWEDLYYVATFMPITLSLPLMYFMAFGIAFLIRTVYNKLSQQREKKLRTSWTDNADEVEIRVEAYGLGRYDGEHGESSSIVVPIEIFRTLSEKYMIPVDELFRSYAKGVMEGLAEEAQVHSKRQAAISRLMGTPEKN